jgi:hypothetical protein
MNTNVAPRAQAPRLSADQIAALFAQRLPETGGWISAKQIDWLLSEFAREHRIPRQRTATGALADGREWVATKSGNANGAGTLHLVSVERRAEAVATVASEEACRRVNEEASALLLAGKLDEAKALLTRFGAEQGR